MKSNTSARIALGIWVVGVAAITLNRTDPLSNSVPWLARAISRVTGISELDVVAVLYALEWPANVLMFVPLGLLLVGAFGLRFRPVAVATLSITLAIEITQGLMFGTRDASVLDVLANFVGGLLGYWLVSTFLRKDSLNRAKH